MNRKPSPEELLKQMFSDENLKAFTAFFGEEFKPAKKPQQNEAKPKPKSEPGSREPKA